jgi:hypothetical protein
VARVLSYLSLNYLKALALLSSNRIEPAQLVELLEL